MAVVENHITAPYLLIIDTDQYAGNFERQLTGFCTGVDDGTHGEREAEDLADFLEDNPEFSNDWEHKIITNPDDNGYDRVCSIWPTPGRFNNGMGYHYGEDDDMDDVRAALEQSTRDYNAPHIKEMKRRLAEQDFDSKLGWTEDTVKETLARYEDDNEAAKTVTIGRYPAYESVVIFLNQPPTAEDMKLFRTRLDDFASDMMVFGRRTGKKLTIKNIRLVKRVVETVDTEVPLP